MSLNRGNQLPDYLQISIGTVIRAWRVARGLTLEELASNAGGGVTRGYLSQLENDKIHTPSEEKLALVAHALDIAPLVLVTRTFPAVELPSTSSTAGGDATVASRRASGSAAASDVDLSRLSAALSRVPTARRQQYVDALVALVEHLASGEREGPR